MLEAKTSVGFTSLLSPARRSRQGISLLEIVLALGLMAIAGTLFTQLVGLGNKSAAYTRDMSTAQILAESLMADIQAGVMPLATSGEVPTVTHPEWSYSVTVAPISATLSSVTVELRRNDTQLSSPRTFRLTWWTSTREVTSSTDSNTGSTSTSGGSGSTGSSSGTSGTSTTSGGSSS